MSKVYRLVCRNQNEVRQAKIGGKFCQFDPRTWNSDLRVTIHAGGVNREHALTGLMLIGQEQEKITEALGPGNPNVTIANRYRFQEELCRMAAGARRNRSLASPRSSRSWGRMVSRRSILKTGQQRRSRGNRRRNKTRRSRRCKPIRKPKQAQMQMDGQKPRPICS